MRILKTVALAATVLATIVGAAAAKEWTKVRIGTEGAYPPFNFQDANGELKGFDIDIAKALCTEMKVECEFVVQDWDGIIPALLAGKFDAIIASMSINEERKKSVDFTNKYYNTPPAVAVPKDSEVAGVTAEDLKDLAVGAQSSTTHSTYAEQYLTESDVKLYPTADEYKLDLENGRLDAVVDDVVVLSEWINSEAGACCKIVGTITPVKEIHGEGAGIALRKEDTDLKEKFNAAIQAIRQNGTYEKINKQYFNFDVYGG
ncbi:ABC transporter substrate-binding protein [Chthonobacter rhizosphaerae]|uniref:ABC transporter substrate-binding protein n=1 Tax=Chthonobacter rhizosphaerae TaxID=2735553 RepID=UPI0015EE73E6|nr:ABC transporter substrate-binding protein [Chthonobacter rhizosphaerae]